MTSETETKILEELRMLRLKVEQLAAASVKRRSPFCSFTAAVRLSGRTADELRNAIHRKALPAVPCVAKGGKKSFKILRDDLAAWMAKAAA